MFYLNYNTLRIWIGSSLTIDIIGSFRCALKPSLWHANGPSFFKMTTSSATRDEHFVKMTLAVVYPNGQSIFHTLVTTKHILQYDIWQKSVISGDECVLKIIPFDFCVNPPLTSDLQRVSYVGLCCFLCCLPEQAFEHTDSRDAGDFRRHGAHYVTSL